LKSDSQGRGGKNGLLALAIGSIYNKEMEYR